MKDKPTAFDCLYFSIITGLVAFWLASVVSHYSRKSTPITNAVEEATPWWVTNALPEPGEYPINVITNLTVEAFTNVLDCPTLEIQLQEYILINDHTGENWMHLHRIDDSQPAWWSLTNVELWVKGTVEQIGMTNGGWNIYRFKR